MMTYNAVHHVFVMKCSKIACIPQILRTYAKADIRFLKITDLEIDYYIEIKLIKIKT